MEEFAIVGEGERPTKLREQSRLLTSSPSEAFATNCDGQTPTETQFSSTWLRGESTGDRGWKKWQMS
jgi:hypothetical protein